jgi:hypothetical protein
MRFVVATVAMKMHLRGATRLPWSSFECPETRSLTKAAVGAEIGMMPERTGSTFEPEEDTEA